MRLGWAGLQACGMEQFTPQPDSHFLGILFAVVLVVVVVIRLVLFSFLVSLRLLRIILLLLLGFLMLAQSLPLLGESISFCNVVCDDHIIEDGSTLHLPQIESNESEICKLVQVIIVLVLRIGNLFRLPDALVCWVGNTLDVPVALVSWIVLHRCLPLTIFLIIPVVGLLGILVDDSLLIGPIVRLLVFRIFHHRIVNPIGWFLVVGIRDLLRSQQFPIFLQRTLINLLCVDLNLDRVVGLHDQPVEMGSAVLILLVSQVGLLQNILALVVKDQVRPFRVAALVWPKHDVVSSWVAESCRVIHLWAHFHI